VLGEQLNEIYTSIIRNAQQAKDNSQTTLGEKEREGVKEKSCSRDNLFCYLALRKQNISDLQLSLAEEGLSSLGTRESCTCWHRAGSQAFWNPGLPQMRVGCAKLILTRAAHY